MAWEQSDLDTIDAAIASNVRSVTYADGRRVEYQDVDKMLGVRNTIKSELLNAPNNGAPPRLRTTYARMRRR